MTQAGGTGVAYEYIAQVNETLQSDIFVHIPARYSLYSPLLFSFFPGKLVNKLNVNPWINVPHMATDDYVQNLAAFLKENIDPKLVIHVEYSNECWNSMFACNNYAAVRQLK